MSITSTRAAPGLRPAKLATLQKSDAAGSALRSPPMFRPPDVPLPSPSFTHADLLSRLQHTPDMSPVDSPLRTSPIRLVDQLVVDEKIYLAELRILLQIVQEAALKDTFLDVIDPVSHLVDLSSNLLQTLARQSSYFSTPQKDCLLQFSKIVMPAYQSFFSHFKLGVSTNLSTSAQSIILEHLTNLPFSRGPEDKTLDWLMRRPLSRVKSYASVFKKLLHSSDDATELFMAYDVFHGLLNDARDVLQQARQRLEEAALWQSQDAHPPRSIAPLNLGRQPASRSVSGESTSTQSSTNSRITNTDILRSLQDSIDASRARDVFSLAYKHCTLDLLPREHETRSLVCRDTFQLMMKHSSSDEQLDCLVEVILLTDLLLIVKPTFARPQLLFPPLLRGVFQVSYIPTEPRILELDIIGRETIRLTATTLESKRHWYDLLQACENYELDPVAPPSLAPHVGGRTEPQWSQERYAPRSGLPPTPPHTATAPSFGTQPLRVIRENSQLSIAAYSEAEGRTPDAQDRQPFHFDAEETSGDDNATPRASTFPALLDKPLPRLGGVLDVDGPEGVQSGLNVSAFPAPPVRASPAPPSPALLSVPEAPAAAATMKKSKTINLFGKDSVTNQFLSTPHTEKPITQEVSPAPPSKSPVLAAHLDELDLDFTKDQTFDESLLDLPQLPALSFGDGVHRPSSVALQFSPATLSTFGMPLRVVPQPAPMQLPKTNTTPRPRTDSDPSSTIAERRLGAGAELSLSPKPIVTQPVATRLSPQVDEQQLLSSVVESPLREASLSRADMSEVFKTMAECYNWVKGTWTPILMDNVDAEGKIRSVRSCRLTILSDKDQCGFLEILDFKQTTPINTFSVFGGTSLMRDDSCDISVGFDVGQDKVYLMFRCENPDKANLLQQHLEQARRASPTTGFVTPSMPVTPLWPEEFSGQRAATIVDQLKIKLYHFNDGKWINKGSARLTVTSLVGTPATRVTLTGKTRKGDRVGLVDTVVSGPDEAEAISKTGISLQTGRERYMLQFKGDKERAKMLRCIVP